MTLLSLQVKGTLRKQTVALICCVSCIFLLLLFYRLDLYPTRPSTLDSSNDPTLSPTWTTQLNTALQHRQSLYTPSMFIPSALQHNHFIPVTAVILRTEPDQGINDIVKYLYKYPFIKELYIYNMVPSHPLSAQTFERPNKWLLHKVDISIIEETEPGNNGVFALFSTCALATHDYCYIQQDRSFNLHMDTLYTQFMQHPDLIHVNTRSEEYITHRRWQLYHQDGIHTGYANLCHGAMISRKQAQLFLNQMAVQKPTLDLADVYYSLWSNSYPYIISNPLPLATEQDPPYSQMLNALGRLKTALADQSPYFTGPVDVNLPVDQRDVRAACENDKCLFVTNLDPFPLSTEYDPNQNLTNTSFNWQETLDIPDSEFWIHRGYHAAVDGNSGTCWNTYKGKIPSSIFLTLLFLYIFLLLYIYYN
ncbi:hypothetical protein BC941DRAFT_417041 [Chlamydoabsidia padenii]|nr:hypothetical protein BC941DRAFT_417041 [Chlamydoabsidia padenii]